MSTNRNPVQGLLTPRVVALIILLAVGVLLWANYPAMQTNLYLNQGRLEMVRGLAAGDSAQSIHLDRARYWLSQTNPTHMTDSRILVAMGQLQTAQHKDLAAIDYFSRALAQTPQDDLTRYLLGNAFQRTGDLDRAVCEWQRARSMKPIFDLARGALANRRWMDAVTYYRMVVSKDPSNATAVAGLAAVLDCGLQDKDSARPFLVQVAKLKPDGVWPYILLGDEDRKNGRYDAAQCWYEFAELIAAEAESQALSRSYLARNALDQGKYTATATYAYAALAADPGHAEAYALLGESELYQQHWQNAHLYAGRAVQLSPQNAWYHALLGITYANTGHSQAALDEYQTAVDLDPANGYLHYLLAEALFGRANASQEALAEYRIALSLGLAPPQEALAQSQISKLLERSP